MDSLVEPAELRYLLQLRGKAPRTDFRFANDGPQRRSTISHVTQSSNWFALGTHHHPALHQIGIVAGLVASDGSNGDLES